jgi:hypothetical protein
MTTRTTRVWDQGTPGTWGRIGMTALTAVMLGGVVLWQVRQDEATRFTPVAGTASGAANDRVAAMTAVRAPATTATQTDRTSYLASSEEQAANLMQGMEWQGRDAGSGLPFQDVVVIADAQTAQHILAAAALTLDPQTAHLGLDRLRVIDLRDPAAPRPIALVSGAAPELDQQRLHAADAPSGRHDARERCSEGAQPVPLTDASATPASTRCYEEIRVAAPTAAFDAPHDIP